MTAASDTDSHDPANEPLSGVRVVDLSMILAGPVCTMLLADQGADVIKVEGLAGEALRQNEHFAKGGMNALAMNANRGKRSIALDLKTPEGLEIVKELANSADVFIQNFRSGVIEKLGITADALREANPRLITVWISGFGGSGPKATIPVFDPVMQAVSGHTMVQVNPDIPFPDVHRTTIIDKGTALTTAQAITAALFARERTGRGQHVDVAMLDVALALMWVDGMMAHTLLDDDVNPGMKLYEYMRLWQCADGYLSCYLANIDHYHGTFRALGHPEWCDDERFATMEALTSPENAPLVAPMMSDAFSQWKRDELVPRIEVEDVPVGPALTPDEVPHHEQVVHNNKLHVWEHSHAGKVRQAAPAANFSDTSYEPKWSVPLVGEHTDEVLGEMGRTAEEIAELRSTSIVV